MLFCSLANTKSSPGVHGPSATFDKKVIEKPTNICLLLARALNQPGNKLLA